MAEWCMAHPWMTFCLIFLAIMLCDNIIGNICRVFMALIESSISRANEEGETHSEEGDGNG